MQENGEPNLVRLFKNYSFVGCVNENLALIQHQTDLFLCNAHVLRYRHPIPTLPAFQDGLDFQPWQVLSWRTPLPSVANITFPHLVHQAFPCNFSKTLLYLPPLVVPVLTFQK